MQSQFEPRRGAVHLIDSTDDFAVAIQQVLETASGKPARNELNDEREIAIWKTGVTL